VPPLDGAYQLDFDNSKETINGQPVAHPDGNVSWWMWFRSACTSAGCAATGMLFAVGRPRPGDPPLVLDPGSLLLQRRNATDYVLHWINGRWQSDDQTRTYEGICAKPTLSPGAGRDHETSIATLSLEPQPDGTYRGTDRSTIQTNECGNQGNVDVVPFAARRTGPVPPGVVADPPTQSSLPQTPTSIRPTAGPTP
jgi:serine/threonine protein kinase, bacterial